MTINCYSCKIPYINIVYSFLFFFNLLFAPEKDVNSIPKGNESNNRHLQVANNTVLVDNNYKWSYDPLSNLKAD